jgi:hypothetical protein
MSKGAGHGERRASALRGTAAHACNRRPSHDSVPRRANALRSPWLLALFLIPTSAFAQGEPVTRRPYDVQVVILLAEHRFLSTELFQSQFPREVVQQSNLALGPLARVDLAASHPLTESIRRDGLDAAIDAHQEVSQRRTWFFTVQFQDGQFRLQGRYFDGLTGLPGPPTRSVTTGDRGRLAHLAARMIAEPFALVGVVAVKGKLVDLTLYGGQLSDAADLRAGAVFAISRLAMESGKWQAQRVAWAVLETKERARAGQVSCQYWRRFQEELTPSERVIYRALLLPTRSGPLTLQVIDKDSSQPLAGVGVKVGGGVKREVELVTDAAGVVATDKINGLAHIKLSRGATILAQFSAPIVDDRPLVCVVSTKPEAEVLASLEIRQQQLVSRILGTLQVVNIRFSEQSKYVSQSSLEVSREYAKQTLGFLDREIAEIGGERDELKLTASKKGPNQWHDDADKGMAVLATKRGAVSDSIGRLTQMIADRDRQTAREAEAQKFVEQAALFESQAKFDEAIDAYAKAAKILPEPGEVGKRLAALRADWELKDDKHKRARQFLVETWPKVDVLLLKDHLVGAKEALDRCRDAGDRLTPRRFLMANVDHLANIGKIVKTLSQSRLADDRLQLKAWEDTVATLRRLNTQATEQAEPIKAGPAKAELPAKAEKK